MKRLLAVAVAAALPVAAFAQPTTWILEPNHTHASFSVRHLVISNVRGEFGKTTGTVKLDDKDLTRSSVEATIETATIDTRVADRDAHLKSPDFFDVAKFPTMSFRSTKIRKAGAGKLDVVGDLTIKGITKPVVLHVTGPTKAIKDPTGSLRRGISATAKIDRRDFGLNWSKLVEAGPVVGDEVSIEIEAELVEQDARQAAR